MKRPGSPLKASVMMSFGSKTFQTSGTRLRKISGNWGSTFATTTCPAVTRIECTTTLSDHRNSTTRACSTRSSQPYGSWREARPERWWKFTAERKRTLAAREGRKNRRLAVDRFWRRVHTIQVTRGTPIRSDGPFLARQDLSSTEVPSQPLSSRAPCRARESALATYPSPLVAIISPLEAFSLQRNSFLLSLKISNLAMCCSMRIRDIVPCSRSSTPTHIALRKVCAARMLASRCKRIPVEIDCFLGAAAQRAENGVEPPVRWRRGRAPRVCFSCAGLPGSCT